MRVSVKVVEGSRERVQAFEGVCIARKNRGINSAFTVRKISYGEGVERIFPLYSPQIAEIEVVRRGRVRRAKLYYLRGRTGKAARIVERRDERGRNRVDGAEPMARPTAMAAAARTRPSDAPRRPQRERGHGPSAERCSTRSGTPTWSSGRRTAPACSTSTAIWCTR